MTPSTQTKLIHWLRWIAVIPAGLVAWQVSLFLGMMGLGALEGICPPEQVISGTCNAEWFPDAVALLIYAGVAVAATLILLFAVWMAPTHKVRVAWGVYLSGILVALVMAILAGAWWEWLVAVVFGGITLALVLKFLSRR